MIRSLAYKRALAVLSAGGLIACPTEAVYGLSCDPWNPSAVARLLALKARAASKGLILVGSSVTQFQWLLSSLPTAMQKRIESSWPGPVTWVVPAPLEVPFYLRGDHHTIAIRVSNHPSLQFLCNKFGPLISTSANPQGKRPARTALQVRRYFGNGLDFLLQDSLGKQSRPTQIFDALSGKTIRS